MFFGIHLVFIWYLFSTSPNLIVTQTKVSFLSCHPTLLFFEISLNKRLIIIALPRPPCPPTHVPQRIWDVHLVYLFSEIFQCRHVSNQWRRAANHGIPPQLLINPSSSTFSSYDFCKICNILFTLERNAWTEVQQRSGKVLGPLHVCLVSTCPLHIKHVREQRWQGESHKITK